MPLVRLCSQVEVGTMRAMSERPSHCVAVIGGSTAGAEVAKCLADRGVSVVVFEQKARPYGKVEDGLPRWHVALRNKEYETIGSKLDRPEVQFVPLTRIGIDIDFRELAEEWGFSAVVLANGAWRDRPVPVEGADEYVGRGLVYQNPFIISFNHKHEADFEGERFDALDGAMVIGGGLASIDVAKAHMLEITQARLAERGIEIDLVELEVKGIPKTLQAHGIELEDLGIEGCTIYYRRRPEDMPLMEAPEGADEARIEKVRAGRKRMLEKAMAKYCFDLQPLSAPDGLIVENDRLVGLRFRRTKIEGGRVIPTDETYEARGSCVVSSIGSIPEPIEGIEMKGELFNFSDWDFGRLERYPNVFSAGNVVTGKGNIVASRKHAHHVAEDAIEAFLGIQEGDDRSAEAAASPSLGSEDATRVAHAIHEHLETCAPITQEAFDGVMERVAERQKQIGYTGQYSTWIEQVKPKE